ncbi:hypothetical protein VDGD_21690 [Verticillium dahliae]|nr:hypothetical protein VDGD_21690 [Verticillium dahliae]
MTDDSPLNASGKAATRVPRRQRRGMVAVDKAAALRSFFACAPTKV